MTLKIAVLSRDSELYSTRRLLEAAQERGHVAQIINHLKCNLEIDPAGPQIHYNGSYITDVDAIIPRIGASVTFYGTAVVRQFEMMSVFTVADSRSIVHARDKLRCSQLLSKYKIGQPKTVFTNYSKNVEHVVESAGGTPVVLKLLQETTGIGAVLAEDKAAAESVLEAFNGVKARVIVQEYIKEAKGTDIRVLVVDGDVIAAIKRFNKNVDFQTNRSSRKKSKPVNLSDAEKQMAIMAARALKLSVAGVHLIQSNRGPLVLEVNSSPGLQELESVTKLDIAGKIIEFIERSVKKEEE
ncbi:MAG: 30S ribosomal protein S6--L-glutamate ligase [Bacteroidetes bacterium]|nr:30S ribosomal protein S6--L-glutamate ligase [Bacteroidota bacterium]